MNLQAVLYLDAEVVLLPLTLLGAISSSADFSALPLLAAHALKCLGFHGFEGKRDTIDYWLVVWNIFHILEIIIPTD